MLHRILRLPVGAPTSKRKNIHQRRLSLGSLNNGSDPRNRKKKVPPDCRVKVHFIAEGTRISTESEPSQQQQRSVNAGRYVTKCFLGGLTAASGPRPPTAFSKLQHYFDDVFLNIPI
ncbi:hypothetical protein EVAR_10024_1 [Eumeta japonica]|uniref:Uncharacterized protein n=1 Tax=Eumeta variegata TaxID=151549 RepID=A0A4C1TR32_EUMVA|nr:hypothetical protein EVAR_10024_1 [Eumeta japonica]